MTAPSSSDHRAAGWISDFLWKDGRVEVRKTGVRLALDHRLLLEIASWSVYLTLLWTWAAFAFLFRRDRLSLWFAPDLPRPWYMVRGAAMWSGRGAAMWSGIGVASEPALADAAFYFDDVTRGSGAAAPTLRNFNLGCGDVSKSHVARVFEAVFGYPLTVDPRTAVGDIVEKSEKNGVHDGRIVRAPLIPRPGHVYQRLVDTTDSEGFSRDLRTPCVDGEPVVVWVKVKPAGDRFAIHNRRARLQTPAETFSPRELALIRAFNARMGADWAGLDILRDRDDGRIYIVDVNKTDVGPVIALSWLDKIRSMHRLGKALERMIRHD
ncbi:MAG: hypothetical protein GC145_08840 [Caulobacter sp.]|nr:hypothetical protein [Caulobacter sp.]